MRRLLAIGVGVIALSGCGSSSPKEASYEIWQNSCATLQKFTRAEVISTWGTSAISRGELRDGPAAINRECDHKG